MPRKLSRTEKRRRSRIRVLNVVGESDPARNLGDSSGNLEERAYQDEAVARALEHDGFCIFMEQRTGKTPVARRIIEARQPELVFIACTKNAIDDVWSKHLLAGSWKGECIILNHESVWSQRKRLKRMIQKVGSKAMVIFDESHRGKNKSSKISRAMRTIAKKARWKLALSGTPMEGDIEDFWAQFDFIDPSIFGDYKTFRADYLVMGGWMNRKVVGSRNQDRFTKIKDEYSFRVLLEDVKKEKTDIQSFKVVFDLAEEKPYYERMHRDFLIELNKKVYVKELQADGSYEFVLRPKRIIAQRIISQAMKLHQVTGGNVFDEEGHVHHLGDEKLAWCGALIEHMPTRPLVIICRFIPELLRIAALVKALGRTPTLISGSHKDYVSGTPFDVAVVQIRSGISIDLAHAEDCIFYSWTYSYLDYDQAKFRIRSFHGVRAHYYYLVARGTIDEELYRTVFDKLSFSQVIVDSYRRKGGH